jgi:hypothetical protein
MDDHPTTTVQCTRSRHRQRLLALLHDTRADAPVPLHAELLLNQIHSTLREQIAAGHAPPNLDEADQTFTTLLFDYRAPNPA